MLLQESDNIEIFNGYTTSYKEILGYLPVLDHETHAYFSIANIHPNKVFERVTPVVGYMSESVITDLELWYERDTLPQKTRHSLALDHELNREEALERCKYCVWFVGCDDGDKFMRFESKEDALKFLEDIEFFDEIHDHPLCQNW